MSFSWTLVSLCSTLELYASTRISSLSVLNIAIISIWYRYYMTKPSQKLNRTGEKRKKSPQHSWAAESPQERHVERTDLFAHSVGSRASRLYPQSALCSFTYHFLLLSTGAFLVAPCSLQYLQWGKEKHALTNLCREAASRIEGPIVDNQGYLMGPEGRRAKGVGWREGCGRERWDARGAKKQWKSEDKRGSISVAGFMYCQHYPRY